MGWLDSFTGKTIGLDTAPIIYFIEEGRYLDVTKPFFESLSRRDFNAVTSTITLLEVLVQPYRDGNAALAEKYRDILMNSENLLIVPLVNDIADSAANIRGKYGIRVPDSIQIATAVYSGATVFLTNDKNLKKIKEIEVIVLDEIARQ